MSKFTFNGPVEAKSIGDHNQITIDSPRHRPTAAAPARPSPTDDGDDYDLAFSFAAPDREYVAATKAACDELGLRVMFDEDMSNEWWGANYIAEQRKIYGKRTLFVVPFYSDAYLDRPIPRDELMAATWADVERGGGYLLPVLMGDISVPTHLLHKQIGYLNADNYSPEELAAEMRVKVDRAKERHTKRSDPS
jgi:hypothetical protein